MLKYNYKKKFNSFNRIKFPKHFFTYKKKKFVKQFFLYKKKLKLSKIWIKKIRIKKKKFIYLRIRKKYFVWTKKKKHKRLRHINNFFFFFSRRKKIYPRLSLRWLHYRINIKKNRLLNIDKEIKKYIPTDFKRRFSSRLKHKVLKKRSFFLKLLNYYKLSDKRSFKYIKKSLKKKKNKLRGLIFFLEFRIASVCVRLHFFWTIAKAHFWVNNGTIAVNNLQVININFKLMLNDYIKILGPKKLWSQKLTTFYGVFFFHSKYNIAINYSVLCYKQKSGVLIKFPKAFSEIKLISKKRRKNWININFFLYLINSFY